MEAYAHERQAYAAARTTRQGPWPVNGGTFLESLGYADTGEVRPPPAPLS